MKKNYEEFKAINDKVEELYEAEKYEDAIELLEKSYDRLPEYHYDLTSDTLYIYRAMKNYTKCLELLKEGIDNGYFYGLKWKSWDPVKSYPSWKEIEARNEENRAPVLAKSKMECKIYTPVGYNKDKIYPVCFILHGDTNNLDRFTNEWQPDVLTKNGYIVAYIQSSNPVATSYFAWSGDYNNSRKDISECYEVLCRDYSIDKTKVILAGFSGGSMACLNAVMNNIIPVQGIIALCPNETEDCNDENIKKAAERGIRLVLLEGEKSGEVSFHLELIKSATKYKLPTIYMINKNAGHNIPENWDEVVKKAVDFIQVNYQ